MKINHIVLFKWIITLFLSASSVLAVTQQDRAEMLIMPEQLLEMMNKNQPVTVLDVRTEGQYKSSTLKIKGSMHVGEEELDEKLKDVLRDQLIVTYCSWPDEATSARVVQILRQKGFKNTRALKGGYYAWLRMDGPMEEK